MRLAITSTQAPWRLGIIALILSTAGCGSPIQLGADQTAAPAPPAGSMAPARTPDPAQAALPQMEQLPTMTPRIERDPHTQESDTIAIRGTVVTADGLPIEEAMIDLDPLDSNGLAFEALAVVSDAYGQYRWDVRPGRYQLLVTAVGYQPATQEVVVAAGAPVTTTTVLVAQTGQ